MGYIEETGIAQQFRDVRITTIYEGTTGIQALDLVGRKLIRDMGASVTAVIGQMKTFTGTIESFENADIKAIGAALKSGIDALAETSQWIGMNAMADLRKAFGCSVPYLRLWGIVAGGWQMARAAQIALQKVDANDPEADFYRAKLATARFYADHILTQAASLRSQIIEGAADVMALPEAQFDVDRKAAALV
jgi:3-(methylthio)propanoyl-CoA dehydrogenase